jgi:nucleoside-diphosphate-sugar epimerase
MKILVTGNKGFVGTETQKLLEQEGHTVIGYDLMDGFDIRDSKQLDDLVGTYNGEKGVYFGGKIDRILHLAAIARFADADKDPRLAFETNVVGTSNIAYVAKKYHLPVVYSSTGSVYMPVLQDDKILSEDSRAVGNSQYGCTKYLGETYIRDVNPHIILRYAHLLGAEKRYHGLVGGILNRVERGMAPVLFGGKQSNDFTYIKDIALANLKALTAPWDSWNQVYNIGTGEEITAEDAANIVCEVFEYSGKIERQEMRTVDPMRFWFDVSKAKNMIGFVAQYNFKDALVDMKKEMGYNVTSEQTPTK